jgi:hypothetical protein
VKSADPQDHEHAAYHASTDIDTSYDDPPFEYRELLFFLTQSPKPLRGRVGARAATAVHFAWTICPDAGALRTMWSDEGGLTRPISNSHGPARF